jgi:phage terminase small subunit
MADEKKYTLQELKKKLTDKEKAFCHEYIIDWNGTRAAKDAGYSEKSARQIATVTLSKAYIQQYIDFIKDDIAKEAKISKLALISELKKIALSDISEIYLDWFKMEDFNKLKKSNPEILSCIQEINTKVQKVKVEGEETPIEVEYVKIKMYDKRGAIMDIMKSMGWDKVEDKAELADNVIMLNFGGAVDMSDYLEDDEKD